MSDYKKRIGGQIKELRLKNGLTQIQLAEKCNTSKSEISQIENGKYNPSLEFVYRIISVMGKEIENLNII